MSRAPIKWNLVIYQGATFRDTRCWKVGATEASAVPVDLTGCTARAHVRAEIESPGALLTLTTKNGGIVLGREPGAIDLYLSDEETEQITGWDSGVWDLEIEFANGDVRRLFYGSVAVSPEVTRND